MLQEISGISAAGAYLPAWSLPVRPPVAQATAAAGGTAGGAAGERSASGAARPLRPLTWELPERFTLAGPSPAFQASLLEMERDFQTLIARIEATRAKADADRAFAGAARLPAAPPAPEPPRPAPPADTAAAVAEANGAAMGVPSPVADRPPGLAA